jgi:hypothetical protein
MCMTDDEFEEWSRRPDSLLPGWTVDVVSDALGSGHLAAALPGDGDKRHLYEVYVQGSLANDTNIKRNSDVDLVIQLKMPFEEDLEDLDGASEERFREYYHRSEYEWEDFRLDVEATLKRSFWVDSGNRCVTVKDWDSLVRLPADILVAVEFRRYKAFPSLIGEDFDEGVFFRDGAGTPIVNYPKIHLANGKTKNRATGGRFKEVIRVAKFVRAPEAPAPSYFIECLLYNVPDPVYLGRSGGRAFGDVFAWLREHVDEIEGWTCQNGIVKMFGPHAEAWDIKPARKFIDAMVDRWVCSPLDA